MSSTSHDREGSFLGSGLNFDRDEFDPAEKAAVLAWYDDKHDYRDLDLAPFARFWIESDPGGFKRFKRHLLTLDPGTDPLALPVSAGELMWVHTYTATENGKGAFYEIIACRKLGLSKAEISEAVRLGSLSGGPAGLSPLAELACDYFRDWMPEEPGPSSWPEGWAPDTAAFRSGIDASTDDFPPDELAMVQDWYRRTHGEVPAHVELLGRANPRAYKTQRLRFEHSITGDLPAQLIPLLMLHLSVVRREAHGCRRAVQLARGLGVRRQQVLNTLFWGAVYGGDLTLETATSAIEDLLAGLP